MEELIAKRYVQALSAVSKDMNLASEVLNALSMAISEKEIMTILTSPIVPSEKKTEMVVSALGTDSDPILVNFIKILGENRRLDLIPAIAKVVYSELQKESNSYEGILRTKTNVEDSVVAKLEATLAKHTGSTIKFRQALADVDGLRVTVDDLGIEVNFSKDRVKEQLIDFIQKSL